MQTIYADVLFLLNFTVDGLLLCITGKFFTEKIKLWRLALAAGIGAAYSLTVFLPETPRAIGVILSLAISGAMVLTAFGIKKGRRYIQSFFKLYFGFIAASVAFAGVIIAACALFPLEANVLDNGSFYINMSPAALIFGAAAFYGISLLCRRIWRRTHSRQDTYRLLIELDGCFTEITALADTGHSLCDMFDSRPVIIASYDSIKCLIPPCALPFFIDISASVPPDKRPGKYRLVPYSGVAASGILPAFLPDNLYFYNENCVYSLGQCVIAATDKKLSDGFDAVISPDVLSAALEAFPVVSADIINRRLKKASDDKHINHIKSRIK